MKILILRFSSIGDIVLTTPVVRALHQQIPGAQVHFATKPAYRGLVANNPHVAKVHCLTGSLGELVAELRAEQFDYIIDLHNNLRTRLLKLRLGVPASSFDKLNPQKWLLVNLKINRLPAVHIVQRYLAAAAPLGVRDDGQGLDYFIPAQDEVDVTTALPAGFAAGYVAFAIGAQHATKRLPTERIIELCAQLPGPVVLLGGPEDQATGDEIVQALQAGLSNSPTHHFTNSPFNACGKFNLNQSASLVRQAASVISHDTGLMHIAAAFGKEITSVWGNTVPEFGMYPYRTPFRVWEVNGLDCRPCSKIGYAQCPRGHFKCMRDLRFDLTLPLEPGTASRPGRTPAG
ncbi:glycosyltransferase family 9 protein [Hymenobacter persicinus]|uniref:Glycosyltransferase family 9 protein n=1 Tax=Hymenobacter persicinus TaxID=2025506 RepID=A0A4Q5LDH3_9BACT|nr:glycosyltransferase family 9 protein [Hymenobacter persicinus]RYU79711.1 glycosyltransferase family 9 protein [Hymenobacter persicinus]